MNSSLRVGRRGAALTLVLVAVLCTLVALPAAGGTVKAKPKAKPKPANYYLALGDSLAYGYQAAKLASECPNGPSGANCNVQQASFNTGYVNALGRVMKLNPQHTFNYGCPGESSNSFIQGGRGAATNYLFVPNPFFCGDQPKAGVGAIFSKDWLHYNFAGSQLQAALSFLKRHPNTSLITLDIGANDTLVYLEGCGFGTASFNQACLGQTAIGGLIQGIAGNVTQIVGALRKTAPKARVVFLGLYNPYPATIPGGDALSQALNATLKTVVTGLGARFADPLPVFNPTSVTGASETGDVPTICSLTNMCPGGTYSPTSPLADIHPTDAGYAKLAQIIASVLPKPGK
jgi:lysophospholipase L1-like esterase